MKKIWKIAIVGLILATIVGAGYLILKLTGLDSLENLRQVVDNSVWGMLIFGLILIAQVLFLPAGTLFFTGSAVVLFESPLKAWLICWISLAIGSWIMFWIARIWGVKVLKWVVGTKRAEKYAYYLGRGKFVLPMILLVPVFPDDIVSAATGLAKINWLYFMVVVFITRGIDNFCTVFIGAEMIKSTVGIILLVIFVIIMIIASIILTKYQDRIEQFFLDKFTKKKTKSENVVENKVEENVNVEKLVDNFEEDKTSEEKIENKVKEQTVLNEKNNKYKK